MPPYTNEALNDLIARLRVEREQARAEEAHRNSGGVTGIPAVTMLCIANIAGGPDLTIVYRDGDGVTSVRHIHVNSIDRCDNGVTCVRAFDLDRNAPRSFRLDRILGAATEYREVALVEWAD
jgi:predicted DNA-binding transcriptional regulator YafY